MVRVLHELISCFEFRFFGTQTEAESKIFVF